jgi:hypothetical protein
MSFMVSSCGATTEVLTCAPNRLGDAAPSNPFIDIAAAGIANRTAGRFVIAVNKPLTAPGASKCIITVSVEAGQDFEYLGYIGEHVAEFTYTSLAVESAVSGPVVKDCDLRIHEFKNPIARDHTGERILSLRALLQRPNYVGTGTTFVKSSGTEPNSLTFNLCTASHTIECHNYKGVSTAYSTIADRTQCYYDINDTYNMVSACFARRSGGLRVSIAFSTGPASGAFYGAASMCQVTTSDNITLGTSPLNFQSTVKGVCWYDFNELQLLNMAYFFNNGTSLQDLSKNPVLNVEYTPTDQTTYLADNTNIILFTQGRHFVPLDTMYHVFRSAKPDMQFYEFVGTPGFRFNTVPTSVALDTGADGNPYQ